MQGPQKLSTACQSHLIILREEVEGRGKGEMGAVKRGQHSDTLFDKLQDAWLRR